MNTVYCPRSYGRIGRVHVGTCERICPDQGDCAALYAARLLKKKADVTNREFAAGLKRPAQMRRKA